MVDFIDALIGLWIAGKLFLFPILSFDVESHFDLSTPDKLAVHPKFGWFYLSFSKVKLQFEIILSAENLFLGSLSFIIRKSLFLGAFIFSRSLNSTLFETYGSYTAENWVFFNN